MGCTLDVGLSTGPIPPSDLIPFVESTFPDFVTSHHHRFIAEKLEAVESGKIDRLAIFCPPRHSKSELASRRFPAWYLGRHPDHQVICCSYGDELAMDFGRNVRDIVEGQEYSSLFPGTSIRADSRSAERWQTDQGGVYVSAGVGSGITGRGAHIALVDDPVKNREEADSETHRRRVWNWFTNVLYTRLMPGGAVILIMTRWHEDDLAGRLLEAESAGGDQWEVVNLPAPCCPCPPRSPHQWSRPGFTFPVKRDAGEMVPPMFGPIGATKRVALRRPLASDSGRGSKPTLGRFPNFIFS